MTLRTHELHPSLVHFPLALLPAAAFVDLAAAMRPGDRRLDRIGRKLWWATAGTGLVTGLAGMAASQEIELPNDHARDVMFIHGIGNFGLVLAALGVSAWRARNHANFTSAAAGLLAAGAAAYTGYLGGELVYAHGAGVKRLGGMNAEAPALFSAEGASRLARDAIRGLAWLLRRGYRAVTSEQQVDRAAIGPLAEAGTKDPDAPLPAIH
jgi:uncharacterized membrane protein